MTPRAATPLEPCRCGGRAIYLRNDECFRLACVHSLAAPPTCLASTPWLQDPEDVRQWWNTRAPSSPLGSRDRIDTTICNGLSICDCGSTEFRIGIATNGPNDSNYIRALECRHCKHVMPVPFQQGDPSSPLVGELIEALEETLTRFTVLRAIYDPQESRGWTTAMKYLTDAAKLAGIDDESALARAKERG